MSYRDNHIVRDIDGNPVAQYYNQETGKFEPVLGQGGATRSILYDEEGNIFELSFAPLVAKLDKLLGTVIDEEYRKANELDRIAFHLLLVDKLDKGELVGDEGPVGPGLEYNWDNTKLGVRGEGTEEEFVYSDLRGPAGSVEGLDELNIKDALGFIPIQYEAGDNITIEGNKINAQGEELTKENVESALGYSINTDVPSGAKLTDTIYNDDDLRYQELSSIASGVDDSGIYTIVEWRRIDDTLYARSVLSGGDSPEYKFIEVSYYNEFGVSEIKNVKWELFYDENKVIIGKEVVV